MEELFGEVVRIPFRNFFIVVLSGEEIREQEVENVVQGLR